MNLEVVNLELERQKRDTAIILELLLIAMCAYLVLNTIHLVLADNLLDLFDSYAFRGSLKTIDKFNWVGKLMSYIISVFSMIGLFLVCYQRLISLLYLAGVIPLIRFMKSKVALVVVAEEMLLVFAQCLLMLCKVEDNMELVLMLL